MDINKLQNQLKWVPPGVLAWAEGYLKRIPRFQTLIEKEYTEMLDGMETSLKPYRKDFASFSRLPDSGRGRDEILREMEAIQAHEEARWRDGFVSGAVYNGDREFIDFLNQVYAINVGIKGVEKTTSNPMILKVPNVAESDTLKRDISQLLSEMGDMNAMNKLILANFYEKNQLYTSAIKTYEEAIKLQPDVDYYKMAYQEFIDRSKVGAKR